MTTEPTAVTCPWCHAAPGMRCVLRDGTQAYKTHSDRIKLARKSPTPHRVLTAYDDGKKDGYSKGYAAALDAAEAAVAAYADETHKHKGDLFGMCRLDDGDRCDITAALTQAAAAIRALKEKT